MRPQNALTFISLSLLLVVACDNSQVLDEAVRGCSDVLSGWDISSGNFPEIQGQRDLFFPSERVGYSVGHAGTIAKTADGGTTWTLLEYYVIPGHASNPNALTKASFYTVFFVDDQIGFAGGDGENIHSQHPRTPAVFVKTTDGGVTWQKQFLDSIRTINDLHFFDAQNGVGLLTPEAHSHGLFTTHDGGDTWQEVLLPVDRIESSRFVESPTQLWIVGSNSDWSEYILNSSDGIEWTVHTAPQSECNRLYFIDDSIGFATCGLLFFAETIYQTLDAGNSWQIVESPLNVSSLVHFSSAEEGFVINPTYTYFQSGWEINAVIDGYEVYQTSDGGIQWRRTTTSEDCEYKGVSYSPSKNKFVSLDYNQAHIFER